MSPKQVKTERIMFRVAPEVKELIEQAARLNDRSLADWVRMVSIERSRIAVDNEIG